MFMCNGGAKVSSPVEIAVVAHWLISTVLSTPKLARPVLDYRSTANGDCELKAVEVRAAFVAQVASQAVHHSRVDTLLSKNSL